MKYFKSLLPHFIAAIIILGFTVLLFMPSLDGAKITGSDTVSAFARYKYILDYEKNSGEIAYWNPSQFSGDPKILANGKKYNYLSIINKAITFDLSEPIGFFFAIGIIFYISLALMGVNSWLSLILSLAYSSSFIYFTLYEAGHGQKLLTIAYFPLIISGAIMLLKMRWAQGIIALLLGTSLAFYVGHVQMVFYLILALMAFGLPILFYSYKEKEIPTVSKGFGIALIIAIVALMTNFAQLSSTLGFAKQTMRGGSITEKTTDSNTTSGGLDWDYAMGWSFEAKELISIIVPRALGGSSQEKIDRENPLAQLMLQNGAQVQNNKVTVPSYWGKMAFTSGGYYLGAITFFLFILSMLLVNKKYTFSFLLSLLIIALLALGSNASWFNFFLFENIPLFNKFRAPSSVLSILPPFIYIAIGMGLQEVLEVENKQVLLKKFFYALGISVGILILIYLYASLSFSYLTANDLSYPFNIQSILKEGRFLLFKEDWVRTLGFVLVTALIVGLFIKEIFKSSYVFLVLLGMLLLLDLVSVDRRLITNDDFMTKEAFDQQFAQRPADTQILQAEPKGRGFYRVLDLSVNTFNDSKSCYHHNQIGGYSATKMQRYQDIIENHINKNNFEVVNMLNGKYIIKPDGQVQVNPYANGNAWFVKNVKYVESNLDELNALDSLNTKDTAVINKSEFENVSVGDGEGTINLETFSPNKMTYKSNTTSKQLAIFSESWYDGGWEVSIDGEKVALLRANYILRAVEIPAGNHEIVMEFKPKAEGSIISIASSLGSFLLVLLCVFYITGFLKLTKNKVA